ncbi:MAG: YbjN domain-containing protein [Chloroflexi bacterium]|nr:YbjN domain-containing protein [Chloroflexota bacterium]
MSDSFGIPQIMTYLSQMGLKIAHVDQEQEIIELAFQGDHSQWRMVVSIQQSGEVRNLILVTPHIGAVTTSKRLECLEALMAVNYRIAMGKFGLDLDDGEIRLGEVIPLANNAITFEQFQLAFRAIIQTTLMYHSLLPRIIYDNLSVEDALQCCEQEFFQEAGQSDPTPTTAQEVAGEANEQPELDVDDVMAEVTRFFEEHNE